jgi:hypothetical protein
MQDIAAYVASLPGNFVVKRWDLLQWNLLSKA